MVRDFLSFACELVVLLVLPLISPSTTKCTSCTQEGRTVYRFAVTNMSDACATIAERNGLNGDNITWVLPHQANVRIIEAVANRLGALYGQGDAQHQRYGNTSSRNIASSIVGLRKETQKGRQYRAHRLRCWLHLGCGYMKWGYDGQ